MSEWKKMAIGSAIDFNPPESIKKGIKAKKIPMGSLTEFQRKINGFELSEYSSGPKFRNGDTLVAKITPCIENGKTAFVDILEENEVAFGSSEFIVLRKTNQTNSEFVYYLAISPTFRNRAISCMEGTSGRQRVNEKTLKSFELFFPTIYEQSQIAKVLSDLDAKIELNNKINAELEAMAKLIYDYWFVQFEFPHEFKTVKIDEEGRRTELVEVKPYKSSGGKMVKNEELRREVPEGWEVKELIDIANITMGQSPPGESYNENNEGTIFYQGCTDFGKRFPTIRKYTTQPTRFAQINDILLSVRAPVGTMNIAKEECCIGRGLAALNSKDDCMPYLFGVMSNLKQIFDRRNTDGTTFGAITKDDLFSIKVISPSNELIKRFDKIVGPMFQEQNMNELQNIELAELRDWLLPMLMNGQVRVGDAAKYEIKGEDLGMVAESSKIYERI
jgi:type I restriction enzyme, S subunit